MNDELALRIATFRFGVISDFVGGVRLARGEKERLLRAKAERKYDIPGSERTRISRGTILLWIAEYKAAGNRLDGLKPKTRIDKGTYKGLDTGLCMAVRRLKKEDCRMTVPVILQKLRHAKEIDSLTPINLTSLYRFIKNEKLAEKSEVEVDRRRFEAEFPNDIWQCDVLHGPMVTVPGTGRRKSYLLAIMDDHSRLITHAQFLLSESYESLRLCLRRAMEKRGLPRKFYVDNGACYRSGDLERTLALLGVALTHSRPYIPEGRGKIERWFRTVRMSFLPLNAPDGVTFEDLNQRLDVWVEAYNSSVHSSLQMAPEARFRAGIACVRPAPKDLLAYFRKVEVRRVKKDRTIRVEGRVFEVPVGLINKSVEARFHEDTPEEVEVYFEGRSHGGVRLVDTRVNLRVGRAGLVRTNAKESKGVGGNEIPNAPRSGELFGRKSVTEEA
jgi:transposase InsO family protein